MQRLLLMVLVGCADKTPPSESDTGSPTDTDSTVPDPTADTGPTTHTGDTTTDTTDTTTTVPGPTCGDEAVSAELHTKGTTVAEPDDFTSLGCPSIGNGQDYAYEFTAPTTGRYWVETRGTLFNEVLYALDGCGGDEIACSDRFNFGYEGQYESLVLELVAGQVVVLVVDSFDGPGAYALNLEPVPSVEAVCDDLLDEDHDEAFDCDDADCAAAAPCVEAVCDDGLDDDANFLVDCLDPDCAGAANCAASCPDLAAIDVGTVSGTTVGAPDSGMGSCDFGSPSPDVEVAFTAPRTSTYGFATVELATDFETVLYVLDGCGGAELGCDNAFNPGGGGDTVIVDLVAGQTVVAVVDGIGGGTGSFELSVFDMLQTEVGACADGVDNDSDGLIDCDDADCAGAASCVEVCDDNVDNDGDRLVDCMDHECKVLAVCAEICDDGLDNDDDFDFDCFDLECDLSPTCFEAVCDDGLDDDGNGWTDCQDTDCSDFPACVEVCDDGADNDGDFATDCYDSGCRGDIACIEVCGDGLDNDGDYGVDCADTDCDAELVCIETRCKNNIDDDGNFLTDCRDPDCDFALACAEVCDDGVDNDGDLLTDCADPVCGAFAGCVELCADGSDNDGNFLVDCLDADCDLDPACAEDCANAVDDDGDDRPDCQDVGCEGDLQCARSCPGSDLGNAVPVAFEGDTYGAPDEFTSRCGPDPMFGAFASASDAAHLFTAPVEGDYWFDARGSSFNVLLSILEGDCGGIELVCESSAFTANPLIQVHLLAGESVVVVVDGVDATQRGPYVLNVY